MSLEQKQSWFILGAFALGLICFVALIPVVGVKIAQAGWGAFGLGGLAPAVFRKKRNSAEVFMDERDRMIAQRASLAGFAAAYAVVFVAWGVIKLWAQAHGENRIDVDAIGFILLYMMIAVFTVRAITLLAMYGREPAHESE